VADTENQPASRASPSQFPVRPLLLPSMLFLASFLRSNDCIDPREFRRALSTARIGGCTVRWLHPVAENAVERASAFN